MIKFVQYGNKWRFKLYKDDKTILNQKKKKTRILVSERPLWWQLVWSVFLYKWQISFSKK